MESRPTHRLVTTIESAGTAASSETVSREEVRVASPEVPAAEATPSKTSVAMHSTPPAPNPSRHEWIEINGHVHDSVLDRVNWEALLPKFIPGRAGDFTRYLCRGVDSRYEPLDKYVFPMSPDVFLDAVRASYDRDQDGAPEESLVRGVAKTIVIDKAPDDAGK